MITIEMTIAMTEAQGHIAVERTLEEKLRAAMRVTKNHWMCTNPDQRFHAAVGAVMLHYGEGSPEFSRLENEMINLGKFSALIYAGQAGLPIDTGAFVDMLVDERQRRNGAEPIPLLKLWFEVQDEKS